MFEGARYFGGAAAEAIPLRLPLVPNPRRPPLTRLPNHSSTNRRTMSEASGVASCSYHAQGP
jgi:hypothetical protein